MRRKVLRAFLSPDLSSAGCGPQWTNLFLRPDLPAGRESNPRAKVTGNSAARLAARFIHKMSPFVKKSGEQQACVHSRLAVEGEPPVAGSGTQRMHLLLQNPWGPAES